MQQVNSNETPSSRPWLLPLLSSLLLSFTVCVFAPLETYYVTVEEFWWPVTFLLPTLLLLFVGLFAVLFGLSMLFRGTLRNLLCAGYVGLALAVFLQGNYLNADYGVFNGASIDWDSYGHYGRWNALVWLLVVLAPMVCVFIKKKLVSVVRFVCILLMLMQVVSIAALGLTTQAPATARKHVFTTEGEFELSKKDNIIVFVIDSLSPTRLNEYLANHPQQTKLLDGFTQFTNFVGLYHTTNYAVPVMLGGQAYTGAQKYDDYWRELWTQSELLHVLKQNNYRNYIYTKTNFAYSETAQWAQNIQEMELTVGSQSEFASEYAKVTAFRYLPHYFKKYIVDDYSMITDVYKGVEDVCFNFADDESFFSQVKSQALRASIEEPSFHFYHLLGVHLPYNLSSDGVRHGGETSITEVIDAYFGMLEGYFTQMKALGVYDDATIVITADHGYYPVDTAPIMLVKRPGSDGPLVNDSSIASQLGFGATIADAAGLEGDLQMGTSAFDTAACENMPAPYYVYDRTLEFYEYNVTLDQQGDKCYTPTFKIYTAQGVTDDKSPNMYELGTWVSLNTTEFADGWMDPMSQPIGNGYDGVWLGIAPSRVQMRMEQPPTGKLDVRFGIFAVNGESQRMQLRDNNGILAQTVLNPGDTEAKFVIDASAMQGDLLSLRLVFPDALSLSDVRKAVAINGFVINQVR